MAGELFGDSTIKVHCLCGGFGFPHGTASTKRILLMGRALLSKGIPFHVWHIGPSSFADNTSKHGAFQGITWEYLSPSVRRPDNRWLRMGYFLFGSALLPFKLFRKRKGLYVYCYYQGDLLNLWILFVCRLLGTPVIQECCEWWPGTPSETYLNRWMYNKLMFRWSAGALPISSLIEERIRRIAAPRYPLLKVPVLVDAVEVQRERLTPPSTADAGHSYLFWCGMVDGYMRDPLFMVRVLGALKEEYSLMPRLVLGGPCSQSARTQLSRAAEEAGVDSHQVIATGYLPEVELFRLATHAAVALLPLWDDDRSKTRFPTKLALYAAAGRPVVSCAIGELKHYLQDRETALLVTPGDERQWAKAVATLLQDENLSYFLTEQMKYKILAHFDFKSVGLKLKNWFTKEMVDNNK